MDDLTKPIADALVASWSVSDDFTSQAMARKAAERDAATVMAVVGPKVERLRKELDKALDRQLEYANRAIANGERAKQAVAERDALKAALALHTGCRTDISIGDLLRIADGVPRALHPTDTEDPYDGEDPAVVAACIGCPGCLTGGRCIEDQDEDDGWDHPTPAPPKGDTDGR